MSPLKGLKTGDTIVRESKNNTLPGIKNGKNYRVQHVKNGIAYVKGETGFLEEIDTQNARFWKIAATNSKSKQPEKPAPEIVPEPTPEPPKPEPIPVTPLPPPKPKPQVKKVEKVEAPKSKARKKSTRVFIARDHAPMVVNARIEKPMNIMEVKPGDTVKYIAGSYNKLKKGACYLVEDVCHEHFTLVNDPIHQRFSNTHYSAWIVVEKASQKEETAMEQKEGAPTVQEVIRNRGSEKYSDVMHTHGQMLKAIDHHKISAQRFAYISMVLHKVARLANGYGDDSDNLLDVSGYSELEREDLLRSIEAATAAPQEVKSE